MTPSVAVDLSASKPVDDVVRRLRDEFADRVSTAWSVRDQHGRDVSFHPGKAPDAVVFPTSTEEVALIVGLCHAAGVPVIPFGTGTSCEGHVAALHGGVCIDLSRMDRVIEVSPTDMLCRVEAGVTRKRLNLHLRDTGLFFPVDPGADASLGGMASTRASGTNAVRYGTMRDNVIALKVVLPDGEIIRTAGHARKSSAGYDLTRLFIGAEGTLGVITEVALRLHPIPEAIAAAVCGFGELADAVECVVALMQSGTPVARVELLDEVQIAAASRYADLDLPPVTTLFMEFHGSVDAVQQHLEIARALACEVQADRFETAFSPEERGRLWQARHDAWWACLALRPGAQGLPTDSCVPLSRLAEAIKAAKQDVAELQLTAPLCGHVGDGNFHLCIVFDPDDAAEMRRVEELNARLTRRAIALNGTCSGEHGIGYGKLPYLAEEHGAAVLGVMASIKRALDPRGIMNPGKIGSPAEAISPQRCSEREPIECP